MYYIYNIFYLLFCISNINYPNFTLLQLTKRVALIFYLLPNGHILYNNCKHNGKFFKKEHFYLNVNILENAHVPYVHKNWSIKYKIERKKNHYKLLKTYPFKWFDISENQHIILSELIDFFPHIRIIADRPCLMRNEGEIAINIFQGDCRIYTIMFLFQKENENIRMIIGAIQGSGRDNIREVYSKITRQLHGSRPRDFLLVVTKIIARCLGCSEIWGVADINHISNHWANKSNNKLAKYDEIWIQHGGELNNYGFYSMKTVYQKKDMQEIASKKRAMYRRRYELFAQLEKNINENLSQKRLTRFDNHTLASD